LADAFSDAAAAAEAASVASAVASGLGVVKNTFCLGPKLLAQFDAPTAARIMAKLSAMPWGRSAAVPSGDDKQYSNWSVTYYKGTVTKPYVAPVGHYMLLDRKFAAEAAWAPADLRVSVTIANDPALIQLLTGTGTYANVAPLRPVPGTCPDGTDPARGLVPAVARSRGFEVNRETSHEIVRSEKGPSTGGGGGDSSGVLVVGAIALAAVAAIAMSSGSGRTANPVPEYAY
jgi:hypothetical protein